MILWILLIATYILRSAGAMESVPGEIIVQTRTPVSSLQSILTQARDQSVALIAPSTLHSGLFRIKLQDSSEAAMQRALQGLQSADLVEFAEPNYILELFPWEQSEAPLFAEAHFGKMTTNSPPNDPLFPGLWGLAHIGVRKIWERSFTGTAKVVVAVVDTGIDLLHPDLESNIFTNVAEDGNNGLDDDLNGFIDDAHGWNFADQNNNPADSSGHGTHVAGIIGARGNNGIGGVGVNWTVSLLPLKVMKADGKGTLMNAVEAIDYAIKMRAQIINASWGMPGKSYSMKAAISRAQDAGILFVAAAGNEQMLMDGREYSPALLGLENIISVAASDSADRIAAFSNYGAHSIDVSAPGTEILSTWPTSRYKTVSGTSMAAPHVAGAAALLMSVHPDWDFAELKRRIMDGSDPVCELRTKTRSQGRINVARALEGGRVARPWPEQSKYEDLPARLYWNSIQREIRSPTFWDNSSEWRQEIRIHGAKFLRLFFKSASLGENQLRVESPDGSLVDVICPEVQNFESNTIRGDTVLLRLVPHDFAAKWTFVVDRVDAIF